MAKKQSADASMSAGTSLASGGPSLGAEAIGNAAGNVWHILNEEGPKSLAALKSAVDAPSDLVVAGVGWLAREGKLRFEAKGRTTQIGLTH